MKAMVLAHWTETCSCRYRSWLMDIEFLLSISLLSCGRNQAIADQLLPLGVVKQGRMSSLQLAT